MQCSFWHMLLFNNEKQFPGIDSTMAQRPVFFFPNDKRNIYFGKVIPKCYVLGKSGNKTILCLKGCTLQKNNTSIIFSVPLLIPTLQFSPLYPAAAKDLVFFHANKWHRPVVSNFCSLAARRVGEGNWPMQAGAHVCVGPLLVWIGHACMRWSAACTAQFWTGHNPAVGCCPGVGDPWCRLMPLEALLTQIQ